MSAYDSELLEVHVAWAAEALPGPDYYSVLGWIHQILWPERYLGVGIRQGDSLRLARPETSCIGIDPASAMGAPLTANARILTMASNEFFDSCNLADIWGISGRQRRNLA